MQITNYDGHVQFREGCIVHHKRYDYRGVIYGFDLECAADDTWYTRNPTQPRRDQAWYRVFVDGGAETYVAQENLELDETGLPVNHPLVNKVFPTFQNGRYYRDSLN